MIRALVSENILADLCRMHWGLGGGTEKDTSVGRWLQQSR